MIRSTRHGEKRLKERTAYSKKDVTKIAEEARWQGRPSKEFKGSFRKYLDKMSVKWHTTPIVYKSTLFIFSRDKLITVIPVPQRFHKYLKLSKDTHEQTK